MLSQSQNLFLQEYLRCKSAYEASKNSGLQLIKGPAGYYVYFLINPFTGAIFYIGKGKGARKEQHLYNHDRGIIDNPFKNEIISHIKAMGGNPDSRIFANGLNEQEAFVIENELITSLEKTGITNLYPGKISRLGAIKNSGQNINFNDFTV